MTCSFSLGQIGGRKDEAGPPQEHHTGSTQALVYQRNRTLRTRLGNGLPHKSLVLVGTSHLDQYNMICSLRCSYRQPLFQVHHVLRSVWKGLRQHGFERKEWMREAIAGMLRQGKHGLGHLLRE